MRVLSAALTEVTDQNQSSQLETTNSGPTLILTPDKKYLGFLCAQSWVYLRHSPELPRMRKRSRKKKPSKEAIRTLLPNQH